MLVILPDFSFVQDKPTRDMLENAFSAITLTESWDFMRQDIKTYMFSQDPNVSKIFNKMEELGYYLHSGGSFGVTMRQMQFIAQNGFDKFRQDYKN